MTADDYKELGDQIDSIMKSYRDELNTDERVRKSLHDALQTCRVRHRDMTERD
jgi:hypothetical protein